MSHGKTTQHQKLDALLVSVQKIEITVARFDERINRAKDERAEMKEDIKENAKLKKISYLWDGFNSFMIGLGTYLGMK